MELQNQIYLLIAVFGGLLVLLFVLIVVLSVYVRKSRKLFAHAKSGYSNDQFNGTDFAGEDRDRHRGVGAPPSNHGYAMEMHGRMDYRSDLTKTRNDYVHNVRNIHHNRAYRGDVETSYAGKRSEKAKPSPHVAPESRVHDETFETEVSNIFDMDDMDEDLVDRDSVEDGRSTQYLSNRAGTLGSSVGDPKSPVSNNQYGRGGVMANNANAGGGNRFHNPHTGKRKNGTNGGSALVRDETVGGGGVRKESVASTDTSEASGWSQDRG
uniref:Uncharacterized protein n=1 Tax=Anopheles atroparvus TaxID=41427 RepID=A0A182J0R9_ANOAO